jgi:hypothetical protein
MPPLQPADIAVLIYHTSGEPQSGLAQEMTTLQSVNVAGDADALWPASWRKELAGV